MHRETLAHSLAKAFPRVRAALAYGSAVFPQAGYTAKKSSARKAAMLDCIFAVEDTHAWHRANMVRNRRHYPPLLRAFPGLVDALHLCGAGVVYLLGTVPNVAPGDPRCTPLKYGVVDANRLLQDLRTWHTPFLAGRLHKPAMLLHADALYAGPLADAMRANRMHALRAALLGCGHGTTVGGIIHAVAGLSYAGDPRVGIAEDPRKVARIVAGQFDVLSSIYVPLLRSLGRASIEDSPAPKTHYQPQTRVRVDVSPLSVQTMAAGLPAILGISPFDTLQSSNRRQLVHCAYARLARWPACVQALLGVVSVGPFRALLYLVRKISRRFSLSLLINVPTY